MLLGVPERFFYGVLRFFTTKKMMIGKFFRVGRTFEKQRNLRFSKNQDLPKESMVSCADQYRLTNFRIAISQRITNIFQKYFF